MPTFREFMRIADLTIKDKTSSKRMREILGILRTYDVSHGISPEKAVRLLEELGPTYVKMGQIASNRSDLLPQAYCEAFEKLRTHVPPIPFDTVIEIIETAYGKPWSQVFRDIDQNPLGSASIAQVHKAHLLDGTTVAVKVRRPGIVEQMAEDIMLMKHLLALAAFSSTSLDSMVLTLDGFVAELERTTAAELDFQVELENLLRFHEITERQFGVTSPIPYADYSTDNVLVMEFVTGTMVDDIETLESQGISAHLVGERLAQSYVTQVIDEGFFHADPHPGNILIRDGEIVWIDLGMTGSLTSGERALVGRAFKGISTQNIFELKEALLGLTRESGPVDHGALMGRMSTLLNQYGSNNLSDINVGQALTDIIELLREYNLVVVPAFTMLARGILTLEGVVSTISPDIRLVEIISVHVQHQLGDPESRVQRTRAFAAAAAESAEASTHLPTQISNAIKMLNRGQLKVTTDLKLPQNLIPSISSIMGVTALSMISAGLFIGSSILCTTTMEPRWFGVPALGILGYIGAFLLGAYVAGITVAARHRQKK